jgi:UDP-N-acetylmuramoyl-tripeptide--D-alanyl-D-alanine ligase
LINSVLRGGDGTPVLRGSISPKSFNNDIGVPLAIFPADPTQDYLVLEMGTNLAGEIGVLTRIGLPDVGVITNCSAEHLEGLVDLQGVRHENACLIEGMNEKGTLIVHGDDTDLLDAVAGFGGKKIRFGLSPHNDVIASDIQCDERGTRFVLVGQRKKVFVPMIGRHNAINALAAIAVGREFGLKDEQIISNLSTVIGPTMRLQLEEAPATSAARGVRILNDAYNANPASMRAAIETLATLPTAGRRIAIVGDMRELGDSSVKLHAEIGRMLGREYVPDILICVGPLAKVIADEAMKVGLDAKRVEHFDHVKTAAGEIGGLVQSGDLVLLKGSRAIGLEGIAKAIFAEPLRAA